MTRQTPPTIGLAGTPCRWLLLAGLLAGAGPFHSSVAQAQAPPDEASPAASVEGHIIDIQGEEIIIDLAASSGAKVDDLVPVWRALQVRHPVTKRLVKDRFVIGRLRLRRVGTNLSKAVTEGNFDSPPQRGDTVMLPVAKAAIGVKPADATAPGWDAVPPRKPAKEDPAKEDPAKEDPAKEDPAEEGPAAAEPAGKVGPAEPDPPNDEAHQVAEIFESLSGQSVVRRIKAYEAWIAEHPQSPYAKVMWEEAAVLRQLVDHEHQKRAREAVRAQRILAETEPRFVAPHEALPHQPFTLGVRLEAGTKGALFHGRPAGKDGYTTLAMKPAGDGYFRVTVPATQMVPPKLEYFVEQVTNEGKPKAVLGSPESPRFLEVRDVTEPEPMQPPLATISVWTDYADYNRMRGDDVTWQTEGYFGMRFGDIGIRALRSGFGVYRGVGGSLEELDELELSARKVGLTYGYLEGEFGITDFIGLAARPIIGLRDGGITGGGQAYVRLGNDLRTNLLLGGEFLGGVGLRGIAQLELEVIDDWPLMVRSEVTNQPAGSSSSTATVRPDRDDFAPEDTSLGVNDIGVRGIVQVGYRIADSFVVAVRGSYQGRTINHSGPGVGGALSYTW